MPSTRPAKRIVQSGRALNLKLKTHLQTAAALWHNHPSSPALWGPRLFHWLEHSHLRFAQATDRIEPAIFFSILALMLIWILGTWNISPNPDAYYHMGVAASYMAAWVNDQWLRLFPMLPFTILAADPFPNAYLLQHLLLSGLTRVLPADQALFAGMGLTGFALIASLYLVLRGCQVRGAIFWAQLGWLASPSLFTYTLFLKGASVFLILTVWLINALIRKRNLHIFLISLAIGYSYVAAYLIIPIAACFTLAALLYERRWQWQPVAITTGAYLLATLINPGFPSNIQLILLEFGHALNFPGDRAAGIWIGAEWSHISLHSLVQSLGFALGPWLLLTLLLPFKGPVLYRLGSCLTLSIFSLAIAFYAGSKGIALAAILMSLALPIALQELNGRPWTVWATALWLLAIVSLVQPQIMQFKSDRPSFIHQAAYMARQANAHAGDNRVILAGWSDFPWLLYFNPRNYYVAGMNLLFLQASPERLHAYQKLLSGQIKHPEILIPRCFYADLVITDRQQRPIRPSLYQQLRQNPFFTELQLEHPMPRAFFLLDRTKVEPELARFSTLQSTTQTEATAEPANSRSTLPACSEPDPAHATPATP